MEIVEKWVHRSFFHWSFWKETSNSVGGGESSFPEQTPKFRHLHLRWKCTCPYLEIFVPWTIWEHKDMIHVAFKFSQQLTLGCLGSEPAASSFKPIVNHLFFWWPWPDYRECGWPWKSKATNFQSTLTRSVTVIRQGERSCSPGRWFWFYYYCWVSLGHCSVVHLLETVLQID